MAVRPTLMLIAVLGVTNAAMNLSLKLCARDGVRIATTWQSGRVWAALAIGTVLLFALYSSSWSFARVMLVLASSSLLLLGVGAGILRGKRLPWSETVLLLLVLLFYVLMWRLYAGGAR